MKWLAWGALILITAFSIHFLYKADVNYLEFIKAADEIGIAPLGGRIDPWDGVVRVKFEFEVKNRSPFAIQFEGMDYFLYVNGQYAGSYYTIERIGGEERERVPGGEVRRFPLQADLKSRYMELFLRAKEVGEVSLQISGKARIKFELGRAELKAFYPFSGVIKG